MRTRSSKTDTSPSSCCVAVWLLCMLSLSVATPARAAFLTFVEVQKDGVNGVDGLEGAFSVAVSPNGAHVYATGVNDNAVVVFSRDPATGRLTFVEMQKDGVGGVDGLDGAVSVIVSSDGAHVYVAARVDDAVAVFSRDASTGRLTFVEVQKDGVGGVDGLDGAHAVTVSPDGEHVYAAAPDDDAVAVFSRDASTGKLTFVEMQKDGVGGVDGLARVLSAAVSPDGNHVYTAAFADDAVAVFSRDASTGKLTFVEVQKDGVGGVDGLLGAESVTVTRDGAHVYAAGFGDDAVAVFSRDASTGKLTFVEAQKDGVGGVSDLNGPASVAVSPNGAQVYAAADNANALVVFNRDPATGELSFVEAQKDGVGGVDGLSEVLSVTVSPDGRHVYTAGGDDNAVAVFRVSKPLGAPALSQPLLLLLVAGLGAVGALSAARRQRRQV